MLMCSVGTVHCSCVWTVVDCMYVVDCVYVIHVHTCNLQCSNATAINCMQLVSSVGVASVRENGERWLLLGLCCWPTVHSKGAMKSWYWIFSSIRTQGTYTFIVDSTFVKNELIDQDLSIENIVKDPSNPYKMCRKCYYSCEKCANLQIKLMSNLHDAFKKINTSQTSSPYIHNTTPTKRRMLDCRDSTLCPENKSCYFAIYYHFTANYYNPNCNYIIVIVICTDPEVKWSEVIHQQGSPSQNCMCKHCLWDGSWLPRCQRNVTLGCTRGHRILCARDWPCREEWNCSSSPSTQGKITLSCW